MHIVKKEKRKAKMPKMAAKPLGKPINKTIPDQKRPRIKEIIK